MTEKQYKIIVTLIENEIGWIQSEIQNDEVNETLGDYYIYDLKQLLEEFKKGDYIE